MPYLPYVVCWERRQPMTRDLTVIQIIPSGSHWVRDDLCGRSIPILPSPFFIKYSSFIMSIFFSVKFKSSFFFDFSAKVSLVTVAVFRCQLFRLYIFLRRLWPDLSEVMEDDTFPDTLLSQLVQRCGTGEDSGRLDDTWGPQTGVNLQCIYISFFYFPFAEAVVGLLITSLYRH